jgi:valyl-tRNA synthetase
VEIDTTRPELLPACVAVVCHPDDARYTDLVGRRVRTPVFNAEVPVHAHPLADPEKGTGLVMVCTFGDLTDVTWWRDLQLDTRVVIGRDGRLLTDAPPTVDSTAYAELAGLPVRKARTRVVELLSDAGALVGEPRQVRHPVKFYEKGDAPLEIVSTRQWYLRNGGRDTDLREALLAAGRELRWVPVHMRHRYEHWVSGLTGDWLISRQRFFGVPFPVWYRLSDAGEVEYDHPLVPPEDALPIDPSTDTPSGYAEAQRGQPGGFIADPDVMDTWATSSLTPQIVGGWERDPDLFARVFPMDLRPQAHEIIRTWLFATVVRSRAEHGTLPWHTADISGWVVAPGHQKLSKSKGNATTGPNELIDRYGADAVRYWAACGRPGVDTAMDEGQMKVGRRLATKLLNASRFALGLAATGHSTVDEVTEPLDRSMLATLSEVVTKATAAFDAYDHTEALSLAEGFFWQFCDDYIELVKDRAYGSGPASLSARAALTTALGVQLRLFAPFLPYVTEEVWSWWREGSVHRAAWPSLPELAADGDPAVLHTTAAALGRIRRAKSERSLSMRAEVSRVQVSGPPAVIAHVQAGATDLKAAGRISELAFTETPTTAGGELGVVCTF